MRLSLFVFLATNLFAQWLDYIPSKTPRTRDGKPNLSAPAPRLNGKPDLSGVWKTDSPPPGENERLFGDRMIAASVLGDDARTFSKYFINILIDFPPDQSPMRPATEAIFQRNRQASAENPTTNCLPQGILRSDVHPYPFKIIQTPDLVTVLSEADFSFRQIYLDGRKLPVDPLPSWLGYSIAKWEGDTLVIDSAGFLDKSWLDAAGHPHSDGMRVQERFHRRDFGHMDSQITVDDPAMYTKPIIVKATYTIEPADSLLEYICAENEKDLGHLRK